MENLKIGSTVKLKSGSPLMTVKKIDGDFVTTKWYESSLTGFTEESFHKDTLEIISN